MSEEWDHMDDAVFMFKLFQDLTAESAFRSMKKMVDDSLELKKEIEILRTTNSQNMKSIARVEDEIATREKDSNQKLTQLEENLEEKEADLKKTKAKKTELEGKLDDAKQQIQSTSEKFTEEMKAKKVKEAKIAELEKQLKEEKSRVSSAKYAERKAQDDLEKAQIDLRQAEEERNTKDSELKRLGKLAASMEPLTKQKMGETLEAIFTSAYKLADTYFTKDLGESVLKDPAIWEEIQSPDQEMIQRWPLPCSNSVPAKQMRLAAFLAVLGHTLQKHIFQATYLLEEPDELSIVLSNLARKDPERETYLRSVLLAAYTDPKEHEKVAKERIDDVVEDLKCFQNIIPEDSRATFETALRNTCKLACKNWNILLHQPVAIEQCLEPGRQVTATYWRLLAGLGQAPGTGTSSTNNQKLANGEAPPGSAKGGGDRRPETPMKRKDVEIIWPVFLSVAGNKSEVIMMGVIIDSAMMAPAHDEIDSANAMSDEILAPARTRRQSLRADKGKSSSVSSGRGSKKGFLPSGGGNGVKSG